MSAYFIANIRIKDSVEYQKYLDGSEAVFQKYKGRYLAVDDHPEILEGSWDYTRLVLIEFPDKKSLHVWYQSEEYQMLLKHRITAADCDTVAAEDK